MNQNEKIAINLAFNFALLVFNFSVAREISKYTCSLRNISIIRKALFFT